ARCAMTSAALGSSVASTKSSVSSGHARVVVIGQVLVEFLANLPHALQDAMGVHENSSGLNFQLRGDIRGAPASQELLLETGPDLGRRVHAHGLERMSQDLRAMMFDPLFGQLRAVRRR